ncbi:hypothetical protein ACFRJ9_11640 [Paenarthrobacter sp. NPDC056912]|uniref:hypothetical protein n=1 Tax=Paenarthrobacter sp. NPDC056912 TaxID=3345965 RepID=UPI00366B5433
MGTAIRRFRAASAILMLAILGFFGAQPALATETSPGPSTEQPGESPSPDPNPIDPLPVDPLPVEPVPVTPTDPATTPPDPSPAPNPVQPPVVEPVAPVTPPAVAPVAPVVVPVPSAEQVPTSPAQEGSDQLLEPVAPVESESSAPAPAPATPTPTPVAAKAAPPVASADVTGPLKAALAPVAENNPIVQGLTVLVLILLGFAYFRALRAKGVARPRLNGK